MRVVGFQKVIILESLFAIVQEYLIEDKLPQDVPIQSILLKFKVKILGLNLLLFLHKRSFVNLIEVGMI